MDGVTDCLTLCVHVHVIKAFIILHIHIAGSISALKLHLWAPTLSACVLSVKITHDEFWTRTIALLPQSVHLLSDPDLTRALS